MGKIEHLSIVPAKSLKIYLHSEPNTQTQEILLQNYINELELLEIIYISTFDLQSFGPWTKLKFLLNLLNLKAVSFAFKRRGLFRGDLALVAKKDNISEAAKGIVEVIKASKVQLVSSVEMRKKLKQ